jgi:hypothetical protein
MKYLVLVPMFFLANCSSVQIVADSVTRYCELPLESRKANREAVAVAVAPNRIEIECAQ